MACSFSGSKGHLSQHCQICADSSVKGEQTQAKVSELMKHSLGLQDKNGHDGSGIIIENEPLHQFRGLNFVYSMGFSPLYIPISFPLQEPDDIASVFFPLQVEVVSAGVMGMPI